MPNNEELQKLLNVAAQRLGTQPEQLKQQAKVEILDNGMKIIKESEVEKPKKLDLAGIYDYEIQTYY